MDWTRAWYAAALVASMIGCGPVKPPEPPEEPHEPLCQGAVVCDCWHRPPGEEWQFVKCEPPPPPTDPCAAVLCGPGTVCKDGVCVPVPPTPPPGCVDEPALEVAPCSGPVYMAKVKAATDALGNLAPNDPKDSLEKLAAKLREQNPGMCVLAGVEAIFMRRPDKLLEENHAVFFGDGSWTGSGSGKFIACHTDGEISEPQLACTEPKPPKVGKWNLKPHNRWYDSTPLFYGKDGYCRIVMGEERVWCPARNECKGPGEPPPQNFKCEERQACEELGVGGKPLWRCERGDPEVNGENPYQARCGPGSAWIEVCSTDGTVCEREAIS